MNITKKYDYSIGSKHMSHKCGSYTIIDCIKGNRFNDNLYEIEFDETGYRTKVHGCSIRSGCIKDPLHGFYIGTALVHLGIMNQPFKTYEKDWFRWRDMFRRCYDPNSNAYSNYGALGITVCKRWFCFADYYEDIKTLDGYEDAKKDPKHYHIDKDILQKDISKNQQIYSPETCLWVPEWLNYSYKKTTGKNNSSGYYGVRKDRDERYEVRITYNHVVYTVGYYSNAELAAGVYNYYSKLLLPGHVLNDVPTVTIEQVANLDLRSINKGQMCFIINNPTPCTIFPQLILSYDPPTQQPQPMIAAQEYLTPAQVLAPALQHFIVQS